MIYSKTYVLLIFAALLLSGCSMESFEQVRVHKIQEHPISMCEKLSKHSSAIAEHLRHTYIFPYWFEGDFQSVRITPGSGYINGEGSLNCPATLILNDGHNLKGWIRVHYYDYMVEPKNTYWHMGKGDRKAYLVNKYGVYKYNEYIALQNAYRECIDSAGQIPQPFSQETTNKSFNAFLLSNDIYRMNSQTVFQKCGNPPRISSLH